MEQTKAKTFPLDKSLREIRENLFQSGWDLTKTISINFTAHYLSSDEIKLALKPAIYQHIKLEEEL